MLRQQSTVHAFIRKYCGPALVAAAALLLAGNASWASSEPPVRLLSSVQVPVTDGNPTNGMYSFDISYVDQATGVYYLADRSNLAVEALSSLSILTQIRPNNGHAPFAGFTPCVPVDGHGANDCAG